MIPLISLSLLLLLLALIAPTASAAPVLSSTLTRRSSNCAYGTTCRSAPLTSSQIAAVVVVFVVIFIGGILSPFCCSPRKTPETTPNPVVETVALHTRQIRNHEVRMRNLEEEEGHGPVAPPPPIVSNWGVAGQWGDEPPRYPEAVALRGEPEAQGGK